MSQASILGGANVGANTAFFIAATGIEDVVLCDVQEGLAPGKALELMEPAPEVARLAPEAVVVVATEPVDPLTREFVRLSGFPRVRVLAAVADLVDAVHMDLGRVLCVYLLVEGEYGLHDVALSLPAASAYLCGEHGHKDLFLGVPVLLGRGGAERVVELALTPQERQALDRSAAAVREGLRVLDSFYRPGGEA